VDPVSALFLCAREFASVPMVVALDALLTSSDVYPGLRTGRPVATIESIDRRLTRWGRFPGCGRIRDALPLARPGVESPKETETRLLLRSFDLPEPAIQHVVSVDGHFLARVDLAYPECRIAIEYEGDGHRTDRDQWRIDIRRQRDLEDRGWLVIRVTELDLRDGGGALAARVRRALIARGGVRG
jgi:very-short-patch-repair endonuclease